MLIAKLPETDSTRGMIFAQRLQANIAAETWDHVPVTLSFGVATLQNGMMDAEQLVWPLDHGLYRAKWAGKDRIKVSRGLQDDSRMFSVAVE